jgi:hypothetical protein
MSDYEELKYIIESDDQNKIRYKQTFGKLLNPNGWLEMPYLRIHEDPAPVHKKPGALFLSRIVILLGRINAGMSLG